MADVTTAYTLLNSAFSEITLFDIGWIISIPLVLGTAWMITRDKDAQGFLWLPLTIVYHIIGIKPSFLWYMIVAIVFAIKVFSADRVGNFISTQIKTGFYNTDYGIKRTRKKKTMELLEGILTSKENKELKQLSKKELYEAWLKGKGRR